MPYNVLIVDDQTMPRQLFENIVLHSEKYCLAAAIDSAEMADIYCAKTKVDLILMDIVMQTGKNGLEVAARLKQSYPQIKIIVVTSMPDASFLQTAREVGIDSFWYKEVQEAPILEVMDRTMAGEHLFPDHTPVVSLGQARNIDLTSRELDVLRMLVNGFSDKEIAVKLDMSFHTVRFHLNNMLAKTGCSSRTALALQAARTGIVVPDME